MGNVRKRRKGGKGMIGKGRGELESLNYPYYSKDNKMTKEEVKKALEGEPERCFGYIHNTYDNSSISRDIRSRHMDVFKEWAELNEKYLDPKLIFFPENVDLLINLMNGDSITSMSVGKKYYEFKDYTKEMNYKYLIVYEFDDFYVWGDEEKQKKLATLCHSKNIEVISASEELGHD